MTGGGIAELNRALGLALDSEDLAVEALTHRSAGRDNYERLEFLGDSVLGLVVSEYLWRRFPGATEGELSRMRAGLVRKTTLARVARRLDLGRFIIVGEGERKSGGRHRDSILSDSLESVIAAVYLCEGLESCRRFIERILATELADASPERSNKDPKTRLQELLQSRGQELPDYALAEVAGKDHARTFTVECRLKDVTRVFSGSAGSRKLAEQNAAARALEFLLPVAGTG